VEQLSRLSKRNILKIDFRKTVYTVGTFVWNILIISLLRQEDGSDLLLMYQKWKNNRPPTGWEQIYLYILVEQMKLDYIRNGTREKKVEIPGSRVLERNASRQGRSGSKRDLACAGSPWLSYAPLYVCPQRERPKTDRLSTGYCKRIWWNRFHRLVY